jgi:hypothetical protein
MATWFVIEDEMHSEPQGEFRSMDDAVTELRKRARIPWHHEPNRTPCMSWRTCVRVYDIVEFAEIRPWPGEIRRVRALQISSAGVKWSPRIREEYAIVPEAISSSEPPPEDPKPASRLTSETRRRIHAALGESDRFAADPTTRDPSDKAWEGPS